MSVSRRWNPRTIAGMGHRSGSLAMTLGLLVSAGADAQAGSLQEPPPSRHQPAETCPCFDRRDPGSPAGVVWRGSRSDIGLEDIAAMLAPVLWFSADEPLIVEGDGPLPHPHPCDAPAPGGVVYYQVNRIRLRGSERVSWPEHGDRNDAWGVRDVLGSGFLIAGEFRSSMAKIRQPGFRAFPPDVPRACVDGESIPSLAGSSEGLGRYELRPATSVPACRTVAVEPARLVRMMQAHRFGPGFRRRAVPERTPARLG